MRPMSWYEFLLFVHVVGAVIWLGGAFFVQMYAMVVTRSNDGARMADFAVTAGRLTERLFIPAALVVVLAGIGLMIEGSWEWGELWVVFALVTFVASFAVGAGYLGPTSKRLGPVIEREGVDSPAAKALIATIFRVSRVDLAFMYAIVFAMTVKPTSEDGWTIAIAAALLVAASAAFLLRGREQAPREAAATTTTAD